LKLFIKRGFEYSPYYAISFFHRRKLTLMNPITKKVILYAGLSSVVAVFAFALYTYSSYGKAQSAKEAEKLLARSTLITDRNGKTIDEWHGDQHRIIERLDNISPHLGDAIVAIEDERFYETKFGVDFKAIARATLNNSKGNAQQGASTIPMQIAKNLYFLEQRKKADTTIEMLGVKAQEAITAVKISQNLTKEEQLELYMNTVFFGHNTFGIHTAAMNYFRKSPKDLTIPEAAMLAGIIKGPAYYSPFNNYEIAKKRQKEVLLAMAEVGTIPQADVEKYHKEQLKLADKPYSWQPSLSPHVTNPAIQEATKLIKEAIKKDSKFAYINLEKLEEAGLKIYTSVDLKDQKTAEDTIVRGCTNSRSRGARVQNIALLSIQPDTFHVRAIVGGCDPTSQGYNRAFYAKRQPGSSFKSFVYYTAMHHGYKPTSTFSDAAVTYRDNPPYTPKNYGGVSYGTMTLAKALASSNNVIAVKLGQRLRGNSLVIDDMKLMGIDTSQMQPIVSMPLGSYEITPYQMAAAYATFASGGYRGTPSFILKIEDRDGNIIVDNTKPVTKLVLDPVAVKSLTGMLQGVVTSGTGTRANIGRPAAGKTGTTENFGDAWFVGYTPDLATTIWMGNDRAVDKLGNGVAGGAYAAPIWQDFNAKYHEGKPVRNFK
jgi:penicillin-binding protein 1A